MNAPSVQVPATRLTSIDAYRGLVMFLMLAEVLSLGQVAEAFPDRGFWAFLAYHQSHVPWVGCSLHDLIQPSFSFLVGAALAFSVANRQAQGQSAVRLFGHAAWRSLLLVLLGIFLRSMGHPMTRFTFEDTLTQIGLGYPFLFLAAWGGRRMVWAGLVVVLVGYWAAFAWYPLPGPDFDWAAAGVAKDWPHHLPGFAAHWNKNTNLAWAFDTWFLNLFPREEIFTHNGGGYSTLSFIPTLGTMLLGLLAGFWLRAEDSHPAKLKRLLIASGLCFLLGLALGALGLCPVVKRIWTPSWVLFSGGWCFAFLAFFYLATDAVGQRFWVFPLLVIGSNSIAAYCMDALFARFIRQSLHTHLGDKFFTGFGGYSALVEGALVLLVLWGILWWMYRRRVFVKI